MEKILKFIRKSQFEASFLSLLLNPTYIARKGLYNSIKKNKKYINGTVMDFGCGNKPYKNIFKANQYIGVDIKTSGHSHKNSEIDVFYDGVTLPFDNEYFDSIFSSQVLEHVPNVDHIIKELHRVCKKGGYMLITVPFVWPEHEKPYDFFRYTIYGSQNLFETNGFEIIKQERTTLYIETIFQLISNYFFEFSNNLYDNRFKKIIQGLLILLFCFPINLVGILLGYILPKNDNLYLDQIIVLYKK